MAVTNSILGGAGLSDKKNWTQLLDFFKITPCFCSLHVPDAIFPCIRVPKS